MTPQLPTRKVIEWGPSRCDGGVFLLKGFGEGDSYEEKTSRQVNFAFKRWPRL